MSKAVKSLHDFKYVWGMTTDTGAERIYKTDDGLYMRVFTRRRKNGEWGIGRREITRTPHIKRSWKKWEDAPK